MKKGGGDGVGVGVGCELCGAAAKMYCESDGASLCWECDHKVHGANFLVGKHSRTLLCHRCQAPTPWTAAGSTVPPSLSLCVSCLTLANHTTNPSLIPQSHQPQQQQSIQLTPSDDDLDHLSDDEEVEEEDDFGSYSHEDDDNGDDDDENQVVPWTSSNPPPSSAKTADEDDDDDDVDDDDDNDDDVNAQTGLFSPCLLKRKRQTAFLHSSDRNILPRL